ncbi:MAG: mechanosensitive ion channel [Alteromonadaceae bacterium]|nr:mechanosensitive ion channel [Alteromonadaceae bacterium]
MVTQEQLISWGIQFGIALAVIILGNIVSKFLVSMVGKAMEKKKVDPVIVGFVSRILYVILILGVLIAAISQLGVDTTSLVAVLGAAGLAIGLALKDSLSNFASGVLIVALRPFKAGDFVEAGGCMGSVQEIQLFSTTLKTPDNKIVIVPNAAVTGNAITNFSTQKTRRVDLVIGVSYDADIKQAKELLVSILEADERILKDPAYTVAVSELADSSVNFVVRPWVNSADYWGVYFDLHETIKIKLDEAEIGIPYPQMDVHVHQ